MPMPITNKLFSKKDSKDRTWLTSNKETNKYLDQKSDGTWWFFGSYKSFKTIGEARRAFRIMCIENTYDFDQINSDL
jgi:viroplasmin and RNaseH domain-containing protein